MKRIKAVLIMFIGILSICSLCSRPVLGEADSSQMSSTSTVRERKVRIGNRTIDLSDMKDGRKIYIGEIEAKPGAEHGASARIEVSKDCRIFMQTNSHIFNEEREDAELIVYDDNNVELFRKEFVGMMITNTNAMANRYVVAFLDYTENSAKSKLIIFDMRGNEIYSCDGYLIYYPDYISLNENSVVFGKRNERLTPGMKLFKIDLHKREEVLVGDIEDISVRVEFSKIGTFSIKTKSRIKFVNNNNKIAWQREIPSDITSFDMSDDGKFIVYGKTYQIVLLNAKNGQVVWDRNIQVQHDNDTYYALGARFADDRTIRLSFSTQSDISRKHGGADIVGYANILGDVIRIEN